MAFNKNLVSTLFFNISQLAHHIPISFFPTLKAINIRNGTGKRAKKTKTYISFISQKDLNDNRNWQINLRINDAYTLYLVALSLAVLCCAVHFLFCVQFSADSGIKPTSSSFQQFLRPSYYVSRSFFRVDFEPRG